MRRSYVLLGGLMAVVVIAYALVALVFFRGRDAETTLPTLAALNTADPNPTQVETQVAVIAAATDMPTSIPVLDLTPPVSFIGTIAVIATTIQPSATTEQTSLLSSTTVPSAPPPTVAVLTNSTAIMPTSLPPTSAVTTTVPSTAVVLTPVDTSGVIPLASPVDIGIGEMRVLSSAAPGDTTITELGGTVPPLAANQQWVVVELLLICSSADCDVSVSDLSLQSTGSTYPVTPLAVDSAFGREAINGQFWGHLGFVIPTNEQPFYLRLQGETQEFHFGLQP